MKPNWKDAPSWAKFLIKELTGVWYWYEWKPTWIPTCWVGSGRCERAKIVGDEKECENSLEERPND